MQAPKESIQNKYLQHLTAAHRTSSTAAAVGVGHDHGQLLEKNHREIIYIFLFFNYSRFCLKIRLNYSCFFLVFGF